MRSRGDHPLKKLWPIKVAIWRLNFEHYPIKDALLKEGDMQEEGEGPSSLTSLEKLLNPLCETTTFEPLIPFLTGTRNT